MIELKYKNYIGSAEIDLDDNTLRGKLLFIRDLVTYEARSPAELKNEFEAAVDEYLEDCVVIEKEPDKPFKGMFNVRIRPSLHREIAMCALKENKNLNEYVSQVLDKHLDIFQPPKDSLNKVESYFVIPRNFTSPILGVKTYKSIPELVEEDVLKSWEAPIIPMYKGAQNENFGWAINKAKENTQ